MRRLLCTCQILTLGGLLAAQSNGSIYKVSDPGVTKPRALFSPEPDYPIEARKKKIQGTVVLIGYIGIDGKYHDAKIARSVDPRLDAQAMENMNGSSCRAQRMGQLSTAI
jgi:TonB family protein